MSLSLRQRRANIYGNQFGGNKKQGLAPCATHYFMANATGQEYYTESGDGRQRFTLVCVNQLGGVSKGRSQFRNNADGNRGNRCGIPPFAGYVYEFIAPNDGGTWQYAFNQDGTAYDLNFKVAGETSFTTPVPDIEIAQSIDDPYLYFSPMIFPNNSNVIVRYVQTGMRFSRDYGSINIDYDTVGGPFFEFNKDNEYGQKAFSNLHSEYHNDIQTIMQTNFDNSYIVIAPSSYSTIIRSVENVLSYNLPLKGRSSIPEFAGNTYNLSLGGTVYLYYKFSDNGKYYDLLSSTDGGSTKNSDVKNIEIAQSRNNPLKYFSRMIFTPTGEYPKYVQTGMVFSHDYSTISVNSYLPSHNGGPFFTATDSAFDKLYTSEDRNYNMMKANNDNGILITPSIGTSIILD